MLRLVQAFLVEKNPLPAYESIIRPGHDDLASYQRMMSNVIDHRIPNDEEDSGGLRVEQIAQG